jgi:hypothetical protein
LLKANHKIDAIKDIEAGKNMMTIDIEDLKTKLS